MPCSKYLLRLVKKPFHIKEINSKLSSLSNMKGKISVVQMKSTSNKENNFHICKSLIEEAKKNESQVVFLPECFDFIGENQEDMLNLSESIDGSLIQKYKGLAKSHNLYLSLGGFHCKIDSKDDQTFNCHLIINSNGEVISHYNKLHMFDVNIPGKVTLQESKRTNPGQHIQAPIRTPAGRIGLAICYDLRFPELSTALSNQGCDVLTYPSAFSVPTGKVHWHLLLKARAIENRCYVVAAAQYGQHNKMRASYGHSIVIDPHGEILAEQIEEKNAVIHATLDLSYLDQLRGEDPITKAKDCARLHVLTTKGETLLALPDEPIDFGCIAIHPDRIFYHNSHVVAFLANNPIQPGHTIVITKRPVTRFHDLMTHEVETIYSAVKEIIAPLKKASGAIAFNYSQQNGHFAGQHIDHVHIQMVPRKANDFKKNDDIYPMLFNHDSEVLRHPTTQFDVQILNDLRRHFYNCG